MNLVSIDRSEVPSSRNTVEQDLLSVDDIRQNAYKRFVNDRLMEKTKALMTDQETKTEDFSHCSKTAKLKSLS